VNFNASESFLLEGILLEIHTKDKIDKIRNDNLLISTNDEKGRGLRNTISSEKL